MSKSVVVLTGAGVSAESGLRTFRDQDGLWENHPVEEVASIEGFRRNPKLVQEFYNMRRSQLNTAEPNAAHQALVELENSWTGDFLLVTQNVDDLHERAGTKNLIHMHGELLKARCQKTNQVFRWTDPIHQSTECPCCGVITTLRPHIVWFGEMPLMMDEIFEALSRCDVFISIGTSGNVYPAASFVRAVPFTARRIEVNLDSTKISADFDEHLTGAATKMVPMLVKELVSR